MKSRRKVLRVVLGIAVAVAALPLIGCGGSVSRTTVSPAGTTTNPSEPASSAAAKAYFTAMAPTIELDYRGLQWFDRTMARWQQRYGNSDPSTNRGAWDALGLVLEQAVPKERRIAQGYEAITPPEAFRTAHQTLVRNNRDGCTWAEELLAAIKAKRPTTELMSKLAADPPGPSNGAVLAAFESAATRAGIELPPKFVEAYSDDTGSDGQTVWLNPGVPRLEAVLPHTETDSGRRRLPGGGRRTRVAPDKWIKLAKASGQDVAAALVSCPQCVGCGGAPTRNEG